MNFEYTLVRSRRKTLCVEITREGAIVVHVPLHEPKNHIENFLNEKSDWILNRQKFVLAQKNKAEEQGILCESEIQNLKIKAFGKVQERLDYYSKLSGINYGKINIKCLKSRWGSCSSKGDLTFNCLIMLMPDDVIDSVIIHELCHIRHMNHSKAFYNEILKYMPEYFAADKWIKENGITILNRIPR